MVETIKKKKKHSSKKYLSKEIIENDVEIEDETNGTNTDVESDNSILSPKPKHSKKNYEHKSSKSNKKNKKSKKKNKIDDEELVKNKSYSKSGDKNKNKKRKHSEIEEEYDDEVEKKKNSKKKKDITKKKKKSKKIVEEENESESIETEEKEKEEDTIDEKELANEMRKLKMKSQNNTDNFSDIENEEDSDIEEDSDTEELIQEENESVKEGFKINDYENMTNEEFNERMKSLSKKRYREVYSNYALLFKPILFQLSSRYLSDTNNLISMIQKFKNSKNSLYNRYNKFSVWPIPLSEQVSLPYSSYDIFTSEENKKIENMFKKPLENDIYFTDTMKEETKAYICEYWKKIHHQENFEYEELKKFEKKEQALLNNDNDNDTNKDNNDKNDDSDNQNSDFTLLSDEKIAIIQIKVLNRLNKIINQMVTEQSFINRYRKNVSDFIGINNSGNILSHALIAGIPLPIIRKTLERMIDLTECDGGNISFYKKLDEFIKGLEKDKEKGKESVDNTSETDENNEPETDEDEVDAINTDQPKDNEEEKEEDNMDDMNELKKLLGKYTLRKYGNALKSIKVKKNLEEIISKENVLNLYTFK